MRIELLLLSASSSLQMGDLWEFYVGCGSIARGGYTYVAGINWTVEVINILCVCAVGGNLVWLDQLRWMDGV